MNKNNKRILIVEDESLTGKILLKVLKERNFAPQLAATIKEAAAILKEDEIDLLILDRILPDGDGVKLMMELRERPAARQIPVLILSGKDKNSDQADGLDLGADDYMTKPFSLEELLARVDVLLRRAEKFQS